MKIKIIKFGSLLTAFLGLFFLCSGVFAWGEGNQGVQKGNSWSDDRGNDHRYDWGIRHHYRDGQWYGLGLFKWEVAVSTLMIGSLVESLPPQHTVIIIEKIPYYYDNSLCYRQMLDGSYMVIQPPVLVPPVQMIIGK